MNNFVCILLIGLIFALGACASLTSPARKHELTANTSYWFDYSASRRGALFIPKNQQNNFTICAEPSPDVATEFAGKIAVKAQAKGELGAEGNEQIIQLAKRTQTVMFLREALYRLCELSANNELSQEEITRQYDNVINAALKMAEAELENARTLTLKAETQKLEAKIQLEKIMKRTGSEIDGVK